MTEVASLREENSVRFAQGWALQRYKDDCQLDNVTYPQREVVDIDGIERGGEQR